MAEDIEDRLSDSLLERSINRTVEILKSKFHGLYTEEHYKRIAIDIVDSIYEEEIEIIDELMGTVEKELERGWL